jgi:peptidoglycan/LPS O-acetylase OafA/YrhL/lysophospholipase L1-like esterase
VTDQPTSASVDLVPPERFPFLSELDGLRAIAVMAVVFYHADFLWAAGGFLGVEVFFVISGYLITSLLLVEWLKTDRVDLKAFWVRRARRLLPAVFLMLGVVALWSVFFLRDTLYRLGGDILAASTYVTNWFFILRNDSYFESFGRPPLLQHLWSLSVEEQFYVLWPILFSVGFALLGGRSKHATIRRFRWIVVVGAIASTAWMAFLFVPFEDPSRVYYGTDTRAAGILIGIALATAWMPWRLPKVVSQRYRLVFSVVGWGSLVGLMLILWRLSEFSPWLYRGGILGTSILTAGVIAFIAHPAFGYGYLLSNPVMSWIGTRSYGIYLWHWPIFMITRPGFDVPWNTPVTFALRLALTFGIAELSYRYVEVPIRKLGYRRWMRGITRKLGVATPAVATLVAITAFVVFSSIVGVLAFSAGGPPTGAVVASPESGEGVGIGGVSTTTSAPAVTTTIFTSTTIDGIIAEDTTYTFIGDSVLLGSKEEILEEFGEGASVDATVSRQFKHADNVARDLRAEGELGDVVVLHLGTNGPFNSSTFDEVMEELSDREQVYVLSIYVPRRWESQVNDAIASGVERWPDVKVIDYYSFGKEHPEYYVEDGVHMTITGQKAYAAMVKRAIEG